MIPAEACEGGPIGRGVSRAARSHSARSRSAKSHSATPHLHGMSVRTLRRRTEPDVAGAFGRRMRAVAGRGRPGEVSTSRPGTGGYRRPVGPHAGCGAGTAVRGYRGPISDRRQEPATGAGIPPSAGSPILALQRLSLWALRWAPRQRPEVGGRRCRRPVGPAVPVLRDAGEDACAGPPVSAINPATSIHGRENSQQGEFSAGNGTAVSAAKAITVHVANSQERRPCGHRHSMPPLDPIAPPAVGKGATATASGDELIAE